MHAADKESMRQAEGSGGALVESQAFLGAGKRGLRGGGWMHKVPRFTAGIRVLADFGGHGQLRTEVSVCCGGAMAERREHQEAEAGSGAAGPEAEAAVGYLSEWRPEKYIDWQASEGWRAEWQWRTEWEAGREVCVG
jgi:hypothetical protein